MESIIGEVFENLKEKVLFLFQKCPTLDEVEAFSEAEIKKTVLEITRRYAEEIDQELLNDKAGRKREGLTVERRADRRSIQTINGELSYERTYYALRDGTYDYPVDTVLGVDRYQRVSDRVALRLAEKASEQSYRKASRDVTGGALSKQTVMQALRRCHAVSETPMERKHVPYLHIDADEDHVSMQNGTTRIVPLVSVYEGLEQTGWGKHPRHECINVFHISSHRITEDFWDDVREEILSRYDIEGTRIYIHGDGAAWIKKGLETFKNSVFVLDEYHKNKYLKQFLSGCGKKECNAEKRGVATALKCGDSELLLEAWRSLAWKHPEREETITNGMNYLLQNLEGITVRKKDPEARNGGATEPHVSHVLSERLSSRPMGWSDGTLKQLVPILAAGKLELGKVEPEKIEKKISACVLSAAKVSVRRKVPSARRLPVLVDPDRCTSNAVIENGRITQLYRAMRDLSR